MKFNKKAVLILTKVLLMIKRRKYQFIISVLVALHLVNNYIWIRQDAESLGCDVGHHINAAVLLRQELKDVYSAKMDFTEKFKAISDFILKGETFGTPEWPFLVHSIAALISLLFKDALFYLRFSNMLYFVILIISIYLIGKKIHSANAGIIAAVFVSLYPGVFGPSRSFGLDFPLSAAVCLMIYLLLSCDKFQSRKYSVFFGITLGLSMLIKAPCIFFIVGPFLYLVMGGFKSSRARMNIAIALTAASLISLTWWHKIFSTAALNVVSNRLFTRQITSSLAGGSILEEAAFYLKSIYSNLSAIFFIVFLLGLFFYIRKINKEGFFVIALWFFVPYFIFTLFPNKIDRYIFPIFGSAALISALGWLEAPFKKIIKAIFTSLFIFLGIYQFFSVSYYNSSFAPFNYRWCHTFDYEWCHAPEQNNHLLIMQKFNEIIHQSDSDKNIAIIEEEYFKGDYCVRLGYLLKVLNGGNNILLSAEGSFPSELYDRFLDKIDNLDFLVVFSEYGQPPNFLGLSRFAKSTEKELIAKTIARFKRYQLLEQDLLLPERYHIYLFSKRDQNLTNRNNKIKGIILHF